MATTAEQKRLQTGVGLLLNNGVKGDSPYAVLSVLAYWAFVCLFVSMNQRVVYSHCPACGSASIAKALTAKDFTVSGDFFDIWHCQACSLRFTQAVPDAANIGPYYQSSAYVSHSDTKEGLVNRLYHRVRNITLQSKRALLQASTGLQKGRLLDIGAGTGAFAHIMQTAGWQVTGLEPDAAARRVAKEKYQLDLQPIEGFYALPAQQFDVITLWHVLEHVHDLQGYLTKFTQLLAPNGLLMIAVPNYTSKDATQYDAFWAAYDVPRHLYHFSPESMTKLAQKHGFEVKAYKPMWFDSFYVSMLSEQYKTGNNHFVKAFFAGAFSNLKALNQPTKCSSVIYVLAQA